MSKGPLSRKQMYRNHIKKINFGFFSFDVYDMYPELPIPKIKENETESELLDFDKINNTYTEKLKTGLNKQRYSDDSLDEIFHDTNGIDNENKINNKSCMKKKSCISPNSVIDICTKKTKFSNIVSVILIPARLEYFLVNLNKNLWYNSDEIRLFILNEKKRMLLEAEFKN